MNDGTKAADPGHADIQWACDGHQIPLAQLLSQFFGRKPPPGSRRNAGFVVS